ncbi:unnamed protein product, partial [Brassica rapa subsp. trilocularis]
RKKDNLNNKAQYKWDDFSFWSDEHSSDRATHLPFDEDNLHSGTTVHTSTDRRTTGILSIKKTRDGLILQSIYSFPARFYDAIATKALSFTSVQNQTSKRQPHTVKMSLAFRVSD